MTKRTETILGWLFFVAGMWLLISLYGQGLDQEADPPAKTLTDQPTIRRNQ